MEGEPTRKLAGHGGAVTPEQERAAVVAWLRLHSQGLRERSDRQAEMGGFATSIANAVSSTAWAKAADAIERGDHMEGKQHG